MQASPLPVPPTLADACAARIRGSILSGALEAGARLPPERVLAEQLGVTRVTLRSALSRLAATGLITVRQGSGYTVQDFRRTGGPDLLAGVVALASSMTRSISVASDLLAVRRQLARLVLERLAEVRPDVAPVAAAVDAFAALVDGGDPAALAAADAEILAALLAATGSPVLQLCLNPIAGVLSAPSELRDEMYRQPADNRAGWRAMLAWLHDPQPAAIPAILKLLTDRDEETLVRMEMRS